METVINKDDQELHSVFVESGLADVTDKSDGDEDEPMDDNNDVNDDYDVEDLLKDAIQ